MLDRVLDTPLPLMLITLLYSLEMILIGFSVFKKYLRCFSFSKKIKGTNTTPVYSFTELLGLFMMMMSLFFEEWLTNETFSVLFLAGTIVKNSHHYKPPTRNEQNLNLRKPCIKVI